MILVKDVAYPSVKSYEFRGSIAFQGHSDRAPPLLHLFRAKVDRSLSSTTCMRTNTCTPCYMVSSEQMSMCTWPHFLFLSSSLFISHSLTLLSVFCPGHRAPSTCLQPCGQTGESDRRQGYLRPPESYKIRNSSKTERLALEAASIFSRSRENNLRKVRKN